VKAGKRKPEIQTYRCRSCKKYQQNNYKNLAYHKETNQNVARLLIEGIGTRGIARILKISIGKWLRILTGCKYRILI
jgi:transposase-like protein